MSLGLPSEAARSSRGASESNSASFNIRTAASTRCRSRSISLVSSSASRRRPAHCLAKAKEAGSAKDLVSCSTTGLVARCEPSRCQGSSQGPKPSGSRTIESARRRSRCKTARFFEGAQSLIGSGAVDAGKILEFNTDAMRPTEIVSEVLRAVPDLSQR